MKKNCFTCEHCVYVGDGGYMCDHYNEIVIEDHEPTDDFYMCKGRRYSEE